MRTAVHRAFLGPGDIIRALPDGSTGQVGIQLRDSSVRESSMDEDSLFFALDIIMSRSQAIELRDALQEALK